MRPPGGRHNEHLRVDTVARASLIMIWQSAMLEPLSRRLRSLPTSCHHDDLSPPLPLDACLPYHKRHQIETTKAIFFRSQLKTVLLDVPPLTLTNPFEGHQRRHRTRTQFEDQIRHLGIQYLRHDAGS